MWGFWTTKAILPWTLPSFQNLFCFKKNILKENSGKPEFCVCVCVQKAFQKYIKNHKRVLFAQGLLRSLLAKEIVTAGSWQLLVPAGCRPRSLNTLVLQTPSRVMAWPSSEERTEKALGVKRGRENRCKFVTQLPGWGPAPGPRNEVSDQTLLLFDGKWKVKVKSLSCVRLFVIPWTVVYQASLSMGFSRQEYWSGLLFPSPAFWWKRRQRSGRGRERHPLPNLHI